MPNCSTCEHHEECTKMVGKPYTRLRRCTNCLLNAFIDGIKDRESTLLEIGFGANKHTGRTIMERSENRVVWSGIDPKWDNHPEQGIFHGSCAKMPFIDNAFDYAIAINSMEHWGNYDDYGTCMDEIRRVIDTGGQLYVLSPMNSHGCKPFINDDFKGVVELFGKFSELSVNQYRNDTDPQDGEYMLEIRAVK